MKIQMACFILLKNDRFLAEKRRADDDMGATELWLPGGHVKEGESIEQALKREMAEELGVKPSEYCLVCSLDWKKKGILRRVHYFKCTKWLGKIRKGEAEELVWLEADQANLLDEAVDRKAIAEVFSLEP